MNVLMMAMCFGVVQTPVDEKEMLFECHAKCSEEEEKDEFMDEFSDNEGYDSDDLQKDDY